MGVLSNIDKYINSEGLDANEPKEIVSMAVREALKTEISREQIVEQMVQMIISDMQSKYKTTKIGTVEDCIPFWEDYKKKVKAST